MSSAQNEYRIGRSTRYCACSVLLHGGAAALLAATGWPAPLALAVALGVAVALVHDLRTVAWRRSPRAIVALRERDGRWQVLHRDGTLSTPAMLETLRAAAPGALLVLRDAAGRRTRVVLPADALASDALRRIRVHAMRALAGAPGGAA